MQTDLNNNLTKSNSFLDVFPLLDNSQGNCTYKRSNSVKQPWTSSQRNCFTRVKCGIKAHEGEILRFLTLTSAPEMIRSLPETFRCMQTMIRRYTPYRLVKEGYISANKLRHYYPNKNPNDKLKMECIKIKTTEGANGVLHIPFYGDFLPYNFLCDIFSYYTGFAWDLDIRKIGKSPRSNADRKKISYYVMNQYVTNQMDKHGEPAYDGYSTTWSWIFRGFTTWFNQFKSDYKHLDYIEREKLITNYLVNKKWIPPPKQMLLTQWDQNDSMILTRNEWDGSGWEKRHNVKKWMNSNVGGSAI